jgi:hypothetical protein
MLKCREWCHTVFGGPFSDIALMAKASSQGLLFPSATSSTSHRSCRPLRPVDNDCLSSNRIVGSSCTIISMLAPGKLPRRASLMAATCFTMLCCDCCKKPSGSNSTMRATLHAGNTSCRRRANTLTGVCPSHQHSCVASSNALATRCKTGLGCCCYQYSLCISCY